MIYFGPSPRHLCIPSVIMYIFKSSAINVMIPAFLCFDKKEDERKMKNKKLVCFLSLSLYINVYKYLF